MRVCFFRFAILLAIALPRAIHAQTPLSLSTQATEPVRFVAAHGEQAVVMGYPASGLEIWAYPFQIADRYTISFVRGDGSDPIPGSSILRRVEYRPDEMIRTYIGADFVVREHLFVPLHQPGAILTYDVEGRGAVKIRVSFLPVMNLMWPAAAGGQGVNWSDPLQGYVVSEDSYHTTATIASPQTVAHTRPGNPTLRQSLVQSMVLQPASTAEGPTRAELFFGLDQPGTPPGAIVRLLEHSMAGLEAEAQQHYRTLLVTDTLRIDTPDEQANRALAWSEIALDQAWVCNPQLGCGIVAGYGPSRGMRRPQYAWFFAGDGLVAMHALLDAGEYDRARQELVFILKYQNPKNGMIWHELSQSAGFLDWAGKYPYMFVHVDITFDFLAGVDQYFEASGDRNFLQAEWPRISRAYQYCLSVIDPATGLPTIPAGKEGADEQVRMRDSTGLSSAWIAAAQAYAELARAGGHAAEADAAANAAARATRQLSATVWDTKTGFWLAGHTIAGAPIPNAHSGPAGLLAQDVLSQPELDSAFVRLASARFQTDWGMRSMSTDSPFFNPDSYAQGSVSALATSDMATVFWQQHRPQAAWQMWQALLPWFSLDSLGHMHEVATGDFFHQQEESVPEQTWSSAGFLSSAVEGLFGIHVDAPDHQLTLAPHLPPQWNDVSIDNIRLPGATLSAHIMQQSGEVDLTLSSTGNATDVTFTPELPIGASSLHADVNGNPVPADLVQQGSESVARVLLHASSGITRCRLRYSGGVAVLMPVTSVQPGDANIGVHFINAHFAGDTLTLRAEARDPDHASLQLRTPWRIDAIEGGSATPLTQDLSRITFTLPAANSRAYVPVQARIVFAAEPSSTLPEKPPQDAPATAHP